jgi:hypothetical protein
MRTSKILRLGLIGAAFSGIACDSSCENAQERLDECRDEIARVEKEQGPRSLPIAGSDECNETGQCIADCVNAAESCGAIAWGGRPLRDPNEPPRPPGSGEFGNCINDCTLH